MPKIRQLYNVQIRNLRIPYVLKHVAVMILMLLDIIFNASSDFGDLTEDPYGQLGLQVFGRILTVIILFSQANRTFLFKHGLLGLMYLKFKAVSLMTPISFLSVFGFRMMKIFMFTKKSQLEAWSDPTYNTYFVINATLSLGYYVSLFSASYDLGNPALYKSSTYI
mmetsp:Transcript_36133/g.71034  ORF Transcript_36133/g.71034 Transcript_36133/m.71034 type:complete len:166 (+) Transcript_36133:71-568(+)